MIIKLRFFNLNKMIQIGRINKLRVVKTVDFGVYLDGETRGEILLPNEYVPLGCSLDDFIKVFLYFDSEDRLIATTETPNIKVDEFAYMKVISTSPFGAFLDWGLRKDLLVPFREQRDPLAEGQWTFVYAYFDKSSDRIVATTKIERYLDNLPPEYEAGEEIEALIVRKTDLGYSVIVNNRHWGVLYANEIFQPIQIGMKVKAFIKQVREDEKIDVILQKPGLSPIDIVGEKIIKAMKDNGGMLDVSDKTAPDIIYNLFGCSKKNFKKAIGVLYKKRMIEIGETEISLINDEESNNN